MMPLMLTFGGCDTNGFKFGKGKLLFLRLYTKPTLQLNSGVHVQIIRVVLIDETIHNVTKIIIIYYIIQK